MSGKKEKKSINLIGGSKSRKTASTKAKRRSKPGSTEQKSRGRARRGR
tara:strand:- start:55 stop:198 length:144 start_codon:yes stop_codon:yes gene_type:complete